MQDLSAGTASASKRDYFLLATMLVALAVGECAFADSGSGSFQFSRYLLLIFAPYHDAGSRILLLDLFAFFEQVLPALVLVCNLFSLAALLTLAWPSGREALGTEGLARRIARFRVLLMLMSALLTSRSVYYLSQYAWFAQVLAAVNTTGAEQLRGLQRGVTLFLATSSSLGIILLFTPAGWILSRRALALSDGVTSAASPHARSAWIRKKRAKPLFRAGQASCPGGGAAASQRRVAAA
jgi:hypothetical protein